MKAIEEIIRKIVSGEFTAIITPEVTELVKYGSKSYVVNEANDIMINNEFDEPYNMLDLSTLKQTASWSLSSDRVTGIAKDSAGTIIFKLKKLDVTPYRINYYERQH